MGLDGVELVMAFEEAFGIEMTDEEATNCRTPQMVVDLIFSKLKTAETRTCRSQRAFYLIRKVLARRLGLDRKAVKPDAQLRNLIPESREEQIWAEIRLAVASRDWPELVRPLWMSRLLTMLAFAVFCTTILAAGRYLHASGDLDPGALPGLVLISAVPAVLFGIVTAKLTRPFKIHIAPCFRSIRDLIPYAITSEHLTGWTREDVATVVKRLTMDQLGLDEASYTEDSRFVEDFNID